MLLRVARAEVAGIEVELFVSVEAARVEAQVLVRIEAARAARYCPGPTASIVNVRASPQAKSDVSCRVVSVGRVDPRSVFSYILSFFSSKILFFSYILSFLAIYFNFIST